MPLATTSVRTIHPAANEPQNKESRDANLQDTAALLRRFSKGPELNNIDITNDTNGVSLRAGARPEA